MSRRSARTPMSWRRCSRRRCRPPTAARSAARALRTPGLLAVGNMQELLPRSCTEGTSALSSVIRPLEAGQLPGALLVTGLQILQGACAPDRTGLLFMSDRAAYHVGCWLQLEAGQPRCTLPCYCRQARLSMSRFWICGGCKSNKCNETKVESYAKLSKGARLRPALNVARAASVGTKPVPLEACSSRLSRYRGSDRNAPLTVHKLV